MKKRKMELLALVLPVLFLLLFVQGVFSLQEVAGPLVISVPIGGSNSAQWGLLNDGNQTITVSLNATGDAAKYLSFPKTVDLQPGKIVYINVTAAIPNTSSAGNITGTLYVLQEGNSGEVQINVQLTKSVTIMVTGQSTLQTQTTSTTSTTASSTVSFVNAGNGNAAGYEDFCQASGRVCTELSQCCVGLTCQNSICVSTAPTSTNTQSATSTTTPAASPTATSTSTPPARAISGFFTFASTLAGKGSIVFLIVMVLISTWVFFIFRKRKNVKNNESQSQPDDNQNQPGETQNQPDENQNQPGENSNSSSSEQA